MNQKEFAENWYESSPDNEETELRINGLARLADELLETRQDDIASWFENCGIEYFNAAKVARLIRAWKPSTNN